MENNKKNILEDQLDKIRNKHLKENSELIKDQTAAIRELQNDLQTFFKIAHKILPEIEQTKTLTRLEKEMEEMKNKSWDLV